MGTTVLCTSKTTQTLVQNVHLRKHLKAFLFPGAPIAGSAILPQKAVKAFIAIGYVFGWWPSLLFGKHYAAVLEADVPMLFIQGDRDGFTPAHVLEEKLKLARGKAAAHYFPGVGHFELEGQEFDSSIATLCTQWIVDQTSLLEAQKG
jgi:pimeloyl-ACP methyl ester carboxylesterase